VRALTRGDAVATLARLVSANLAQASALSVAAAGGVFLDAIAQNAARQRRAWPS